MTELLNIFVCDECDQAWFTKRKTKKCCKKSLTLTGWVEQPAAPVGK